MNAPSKADYELPEGAWIAGIWTPAGTVLRLVPDEAKYLVMAGTIVPAAPKPAPAPVAARRKRSR